ncbi:MAG: NUDIX hydrolase [Candidatus Odinarchaeia archaeon]
MSRVYPDVPRVAVGAVIIRNGKVLLVKRRTQPKKGAWSIPGGLVKLGETVEEALKREILEETGLRVSVEKIAGVFDYIERDESGRIRYHYVIIDFFCNVSEGKLSPSSDAQEAKWISLNEIEGLYLTDMTRRLIRNLRELMVD